MGFASRARSRFIELNATAKLMRNVGKMLPISSYSAGRLLAENAATLGSRTAVAYLDERYSWAELNARANRWGHFLSSRGIRRGDVVALMMDNRPDYLFALLGSSKIGAVCACINTNLSGAPLSHALTVARTKLVVAGSEHEAVLQDVAAQRNADGSARTVCVHKDGSAETSAHPVNEEVDRASEEELTNRIKTRGADPMTYLYTSGTTGLPKAAIVLNLRFMAAAFGFGRVLHEATADDVIYVALPLYHGNAQWGGLGAALTTGATLALRRKFSASHFWNDARAFGATRFMYIGELCRYLVNQPPGENDRNHKVRMAVGNGLRRDVWVAFQERFGIPMIREFYGATEGNAPIANLEGRPGMIGRLQRRQLLVRCDPATGTPLRDARGRCTKVAKPGETGLLLGRISPLTRFDGYVDERETDKKVLRNVLSKGDAYFNSGDLLTLHEDSWVSFADRVGDTFRHKGENVSTMEIAEILNGAPGVLESNVYGVVVPGADGRAGMASLRVESSFDLEVFGVYVVEKLPGYARPYFIRLLDDMRVTATLKQQKVDYRAEGFDPTIVHDPLYFLDGTRYVALDEALFRRLMAAEVKLGARGP